MNFLRAKFAIMAYNIRGTGGMKTNVFVCVVYTSIVSTYTCSHTCSLLMNSGVPTYFLATTACVCVFAWDDVRVRAVITRLRRSPTKCIMLSFILHMAWYLTRMHANSWPPHQILSQKSTLHASASFSLGQCVCECVQRRFLRENLMRRPAARLHSCR